MALEHAILVSLAEQTATGYDLARRFDASIGFFWSASHQQIYRVLARMEADEWISGTSDAAEHAGKRRVYRITDRGRDELLRWTRQPSSREALRSDFAVKLRGFADRDAIIADTLQRRADHAARLDRYLASEKRHYSDPHALSDTERGSWLTLRGGILTEQHGIAWCDEILEHLGVTDGE